MTDLGAFLSANLSRHRAAGEWDCAVLVGDWVASQGYPDPVADFRGRYDTEEGGHALVAPVGGLAEALDLNLRTDSGWRAIDPDDAQPGDVGVADVFGVMAATLCAGTRWALVNERGLAFYPLRGRVLRAWSPPHG